MTTPEWETILFIGGPADGKTLGIPKGRLDYSIAKPQHIDWEWVLTQLSDDAAPPIPELHYCLYHRMKFRGESRGFYVMAAEGIDADGVMERLMLYYRPPEQKEEPWHSK